MGMYQQNADSECQNCPAGTYRSDETTLQCTECPGNYWSNAGATACELCPAFSSSSGATDIQGCKCMNGLYMDSSVSPSQCSLCFLGKYSVAGSTTCTSCSVGTYNPNIAVSFCIPCDSGNVADSAGLSVCKPCQQGYIPSPDLTTCQKCPLASYCVNGAQFPCPSGSYVTKDGLWNASQCTSCPANYVCKQPTMRESCPPNTHSSTGTTSVADCVCNDGYTCTYTKKLQADIFLPMSVDEFYKNMQDFINAVAESAGVNPSQVTVTGVEPYNPSAGARRSFHHQARQCSRVKVNVTSRWSLTNLNINLMKKGLPPSIKRPILSKNHQVQIRSISKSLVNS